MKVVDADAHVVTSARTWDYMHRTKSNQTAVRKKVSSGFSGNPRRGRYQTSVPADRGQSSGFAIPGLLRQRVPE
jgi:hypothetical protein